MKRYLTIKNFRNINPVIINENASEKEKEDEVKYGRLYLNGDVEQGGLISIIGANGTGKSNILSAVEKAFKCGIDDKRDNPKIDGFKDCKPELEIFIESDSDNIFNRKFKNGKIIWYIHKFNILLINNNFYILKIVEILLQKNKDILSIYEYNKYKIKERVIKIIDEYGYYINYIDKYILKLLKCFFDIEYYEKENAQYIFNISKSIRDIQNDKIYLDQEFIISLISADNIDINTKIYVHNKSNIKNEELTINKDDIKNSSFLYSLFKSTNNMETYEYLINNYDYIVSDVSFSKQKENEINRLFEDTISKRFNELYKSNNDYVFKIILETNYIRIYF